MFELRESLRLLGKDHYGTGRILDTFGMVYAARDNFHAAEEFFRQAIARKKGWDDQAGLAVSYGNLGRLHLDWGYLDQAEQCFLEDLTIAQNMHDVRGEALMQNFLGRVALERGNRAAAVARPSEAREHWVDSAGWLDASIRAATGRWSISEGFARKDRALLHLAEGQIADAEAEVGKAEELFRTVEFVEGLRTSTMPGGSSDVTKVALTRPSRSYAPRSIPSPARGNGPSRPARSGRLLGFPVPRVCRGRWSHANIWRHSTWPNPAAAPTWCEGSVRS